MDLEIHAACSITEQFSFSLALTSHSIPAQIGIVVAVVKTTKGDLKIATEALWARERVLF